MLSVLTPFLTNRSPYVVVDSCRSKPVGMVSGVLLGSGFCLQLFLLYTADILSILVNKLFGYADYSTLVAIVLSPCEKVAVTESMNRDLNRVSIRYDLCIGNKIEYE